MRELPSIGGTFAKLFADAASVKWPAAIIAALLEYLLPGKELQGMAFGAFALVSIDTVTGVVAAQVTKSPVTSGKFGRVLVKLLAYCSVVSVCSITSKSIPGAGQFQTPSLALVLMLIIITEGISVLENVRKMGWNFPFLRKFLKARLKQLNDELSDAD